MQNLPYKSAHLIGIGGINMSAVAKLLKHSGVAVSGSDESSSEMIPELEKLGIKVTIGHDAKNVPPGCDLIIYSSAVPELNVERGEARRRMITQLSNFQFLGEWSKNLRILLVAGTHGKSTTTAMFGLMLISGGVDPTVIVGSKLKEFPDGNIRFGSSQTVLIEGDEYAKHFLEFEPYGVIINNIELDHTDVFPDIVAFMDAFRELLSKVQDGGFVIANADDRNVQTLIGKMRTGLEVRKVSIHTFGFGSHATYQIMEHGVRQGEQFFSLRNQRGNMTRYRLCAPGRMNVMNAAAALSAALTMNLPAETLQEVTENYRGIWRRFQIVGESDGITVVSDYGHHPTAVAATLEAAKAFYPNRRIVLAFQPHHRNRTKNLFKDFVPSFDRADRLVLAEVYDVAGRDSREDSDVSSRDLQEAVAKHDREREITRPLEYVPNPEGALNILRHTKKSGDVILIMGAGDIYKIAPKILQPMAVVRSP